MTALPKKYYTPEEYLELEEKAAYKSEYFNGLIYPMGDFEGDTPEAMAGAKPAHNAIRENISGELHTHFKKKKRLPFVFKRSAGIYPFQWTVYLP